MSLSSVRKMAEWKCRQDICQKYGLVIDIHCMVLHIHVPFSGKVINVSGRYNFKKVPLQDILLGSDLPFLATI